MSLSLSIAVFRRIVVALILTGVIGFVGIAPTVPAWAVDSWTTPVNLSAAGQDAYDSQIVAAPNNTLTAIWYRIGGSEDIIQASSSSDAGATWSTPVDLSAAGQDAWDPQIVAAPNNTLTAIWRRYDGSKYIIQTRTSSDAGATWSTPVDLSAAGESAYTPQIVAAPDNTLTAIWGRSDGSKYIIQTSTSSDAGATWSTPVDLSAAGQDASGSQIVAAPNNTLTAIWRRYDGSNYVIQTRTSSDAGATWSTPVNLSAAGESAYNAQIVADTNNTLTAIWRRYDGSNYVVQTRTSSDAGATWSTPVNLSAAGESAYIPQIVAAPNNTLTAIWYRYDGSNYVIQTRTSSDAGATWSSPTVDLSAAGQDAYDPQIVADTNNTLTAIWYRSDGSEDIIQSSTLASQSSESSGSSSIADAGVPGIFLTVAGPVGRSASESPVYYGADRVAVTSTYLLTVTRVSNITPTITTLAEGTIDADGSFTSMTRLPALAPGTYNVQMVGTHVNGSTLQLTSQVTIGGVGQFTSIGANIPIIK